MFSTKFNKDYVKLSGKNVSTEESQQFNNFTYILDEISNMPKNKSNNINDQVETPNNVYDPVEMFDLLNYCNKKDNNNNFLIIGKRDCGKTSLILEIMSNLIKKKNITNIQIFAHNFDPYPNEMIKNNLDNPELNKTKIIKILNKQLKQNSSPMLLVLDDLYFSSKLSDYKFLLKKIISNSSNNNIYVIVASQLPLKELSQIKNSFNFICAFNDDHYIPHNKKIYKQYFEIFPSYNCFDAIMNKLTKYKCLIYVESPSLNIDEKIFHYKTKPHNNFIIKTK